MHVNPDFAAPCGLYCDVCAIKDQVGRVIGPVGIHTDITE